MKRIILLGFILISWNSQAQKQEIKSTIATFFEGFHARDSAKIKSVCSENMVLQSIAETANGNSLSEESSAAFYHSIATIPNEIKFSEKIISYTIQVDGTMAVAWTPYEFYKNGILSHTGVNVFTLFKKDDSWKIIYIIDTRRK
ncbi:Cif family virulence factor [Flavobacterium degerlachei]|jgi:hypothetical protein|uniref:Putative lumazine-binding n=1 Tax=Flavobacterium degerlachei TaxID=229203 RepID=A0A1H2UKK5_9FLAO|nr:nuclear transport factor 2 family protein [Flavobacterium degerlachei]SDW56632.1 Putative lumazine-binding [Flavobacterium degerlachei]